MKNLQAGDFCEHLKLKSADFMLGMNILNQKRKFNRYNHSLIDDSWAAGTFFNNLWQGLLSRFSIIKPNWELYYGMVN